MKIKAGQRTEIMCEGKVLPSVDGVFPFMKRKMAQNHYKEKGLEVIDGDDFEHNLLKLFAKEEPWRAIDKYSKVKMGRNPHEVKEEYCAQLVKIFGKDSIRKMLYACRFSSYLGGPGFPEFICHGTGTLFVYVGNSNELMSSQMMFVALCKLFGVKAEFAVFDVREGEIEPAFGFDIMKIVQDALAGAKREGQLETLEKEIKTAKGDERIYWEAEAARIPFPVLAGWQDKGEADSESLEKNMKEIEQTGARVSGIFGKMKQFADGGGFGKLKDGRDEESLKAKSKILVDKFGVHEHMAKDFLTFLMFG